MSRISNRYSDGYCYQCTGYRFEGEDTYDQLKNYISISDDQLTIEGQANVGFIGNVYAGGSQTDYNYDEGIVAGAQSTASFDSDKVITR